MMFVGSPMGSTPTSPIPAHSPSSDHHLDCPSPTLLPHPFPCWATQAQCDLAQAEAELHQLQERHTTETESVKRGVERAILGARREERRLLERVEQDHRDTQQRLEQIQRENMAASRVSQSLLDQRLCKLNQLQQQIQEVGQQSGLDQSASNLNLLMKEVAEFFQPWEISVSFKKVNFKPSSQPNAVTFGDIRVQEQCLCLHGGGCGPQGRMCALHSQELKSEYKNHHGAGVEKIPEGQGWTSPTGRVLRKISLSTRSDLESEDEPTKTCQWESSRDDELESALFQPQREDVFLAVPTIPKNMDNEGKKYKVISNGKHYSPSNQRQSLTVLSGRKSSSLERRQEKLSHFLGLDDRTEDKRILDSNSRHLRYSNSSPTTLRMAPRETLTSKSCLDLSSRGRPHSCLSQSSDEHSLGTLCDSGRAPSPTDSLDSSYTFIVSPSHEYSMNRGIMNSNCRRSKSAVDLTNKTHPLISSETDEHVEVWKVKYSNFNSISSSTTTSPTHSRGHKIADLGYVLSHSRGQNVLHQPQKEIAVAGSKQSHMARSLSTSVIDGSSQEPKRGRGERGEPALMEMEEEGDPTMTVFNPQGVHLINKFGKQGSGRADLTLPSGIHATPQGQLFIVDCGNARVQVCAVIISQSQMNEKLIFNIKMYSIMLKLNFETGD